MGPIICQQKRLEDDLILFINQYQGKEENDTLHKLIITTTPQSLRQNFNINKKKLQGQSVLSIDQLARNQGAQRMIMSETEAEQFQLAYNYRQKQSKKKFSEMPFGNSEYTFKLEYQERLIQGRKVLVIGEKHSGKSTLINALGNSLIIDYPDRYRYHISEFDSNSNIQECDLDEGNVKFKFLEVIGYGQNDQDNQNILSQTYEHLANNNIRIDVILICRRSRNQNLNTQEKKIISHLAELFGRQYIRKCFLVNTNYDLGNQIDNLIIMGLNKFNNLYDEMPNPKILFVNSITTPFEGNIGNRRFETVQTLRDAINNLINQSNDPIPVISRDAFNNRREQERNLAQNKQMLKTRLFELLPCLENYFQIQEVNTSDRLYYVNTVFWSTIQNIQEEKRQKQSMELKFILNDIILSDEIQKALKDNLFVNSQTIDMQRQENIQRERAYLEQLKQLKNQLNEDKKRRLNDILRLADEYVEENQNYLEETYSDENQETRQTLISNNMSEYLLLYLQTNQEFENEESRQEIEVIRQRLHLPTQNLLATDLIRR